MSIDRAGRWRDYRRRIDALHEQLPDNPPPIDYERRRLTAADPTLLPSLAERPSATSTDRRTVDAPSGAFWRTYTGGDLS